MTKETYKRKHSILLMVSEGWVHHDGGIKAWRQEQLRTYILNRKQEQRGYSFKGFVCLREAFTTSLWFAWKLICRQQSSHLVITGACYNTQLILAFKQHNLFLSFLEKQPYRHLFCWLYEVTEIVFICVTMSHTASPEGFTKEWNLYWDDFQHITPRGSWAKCLTNVTR